MKISNVWLILVAAVSARGEDSTNNNQQYVEFPDIFQPRLEAERKTFIDAYNDTEKESPRKVEFRVFQLFPEPPEKVGLPSQRIWPVLEVMTKRMDNVLWPRVHYYMERGEDFGCRAANATSGEIDESDHCQRHCTHRGRYCAPQVDSLPAGKHGRDVIYESLRRMCFDNHYHTTDGRYFRYLREFDRRDCFAQNDTRLCSINSMKAQGSNHDSLAKCLREGDWDEDEKHEILERNLFYLRRPLLRYTRADLPQIEINGLSIMPRDYGKEIREWTPKFIFWKFCHGFPQDSSLPHHGQPLACEVCRSCEDVGTCLQTLECDGESFDPSQWNISATLQQQSNQASTGTSSNARKDSGNSGIIYCLIAIVILAIASIVALFVYRKRRTRQFMDDVLNKTIPAEDFYANSKDSEDHSTQATVQSIFGNSYRAQRDWENSKRNMAPRRTEERDVEGVMDNVAIGDEEFVFNETVDHIYGVQVKNAAYC